MPGSVEHLCHRTGFDDLAGVHDRDAVGFLGHQRQIVCDEHNGHPVLGTKIPQQRHDLGLHRDVQCRGGLVGDQHAGIEGHRHRNQQTLPHPTGELVRIGVQPRFGLRNADPGHQLDRLALGFPATHTPVDAEWLGQLGADGVERVEGGERVLEHDGQFGAGDFAALPAVDVEQVHPGAGERRGAGHHIGDRLQQAHQRGGRHGLPTA